MYFPKKGNTFPSRGRGGCPPGNGASSDVAEFSAGIAAALRRELGSTNAAIKTAATWTNTNDRTVKKEEYHGYRIGDDEQIRRWYILVEWNARSGKN